MNKTFFIKNREKTLNTMKDNSCLIMFSGSPPIASRDLHYYFQPDRNFYYLTGITRPNMTLFMYKHSDITEVIIFMPSEKDNLTGSDDHQLIDNEITQITGIEQVFLSDVFDNMLSRHLARKPCDTVYFDFNRINIISPASKSEVYANEFKVKYPSLKILNIYKMISSFRVIKSQEEIDEIKKAIDITSDGIVNMIKCCKPSIYESDLEAEFMYTLYKNKERIPAFANIIASGENSAIGHYSANNKRIDNDVLIQIDVGAQSKWYCADVSRAIPSNGIFNDRQKQLYNICNDAMDRMIEYIKPGITSDDTVAYGRSLILESLKQIGITQESTKNLYLYCGINHYIGLDVHDVGDRSLVLVPNMIVAVDSSVGIPDEGINFRIEDDMLITENGCEVLTKKIPRNIDVIEALYNMFYKIDNHNNYCSRIVL